MKKYKLISFDIFQTLVDVNTQKEKVMRTIFKYDYSLEKADKFWKDVNEFVFSYFHRIDEGKKKFVTVTSIFEQCYSQLFTKYGVQLDPKVGAHILASAHADSLFYDDSIPFLNRVQNSYITCVISDTDFIMIDKILNRVKFDYVFTSEEYQSYKSDSSGKLFNAAFTTCDIQPYEMLHIGDGYSDVAGAKQAGADAVWINRHGKEWGHEIKPDYTVSSLLDLPI